MYRHAGVMVNGYASVGTHWLWSIFLKYIIFALLKFPPRIAFYNVCYIIFGWQYMKWTRCIQKYRKGLNFVQTCVFPWPSLQWHNGHDGVSNHQTHHCLLYRYFRRRSKIHHSSPLLAFVRGIHWWPVNSSHKGPVTRKMYPFGDVIMRNWLIWCTCYVTSMQNILLWFC